MSLLDIPTFSGDLITAASPIPDRARWYRPPSIPAPDALEGVTDRLDELLDATPGEVAPFADDLSEALELLRNVAAKIADDRAGRSAA